MKFITYRLLGGPSRFGFIKNAHVVDILRSSIWAYEELGLSEFLQIPSTLKGALGNWTENFFRLSKLAELIPNNFTACVVNEKFISYPLKEIEYLPPVQNPPTFRDFYAFEQHVKAACENQSLPMEPSWYDIPVFYFSNPHTLYGHRQDIPYPDSTRELDYELEIAVIIANGGKDIQASDGDTVIGGYTILNDFSARDIQQVEMKMNLGPAKGKDFATAIGPVMVTPDELSDNINGSQISLEMSCSVNGKLLSKGNSGDLTHSFSDMIARASRHVELYPGEVIGSGPVGSGCILELGPENTGGWLQKEDVVTLKIEKLGTLENKII